MNTMQNNYRQLSIDNKYTPDVFKRNVAEINKSGVICDVVGNELIFKFDLVDVKYLESIKDEFQYPIVKEFVDKLHTIRSFVSCNGKLRYANYNEDIKVKDKKTNSKKRLAYEYYKKDFSTHNQECPERFINKIFCADSLQLLKEIPDNCIDVVVTSPPYNFGIAYNSTEDTNTWENYFAQLFAIFDECIRVIKSSGRIIVNIQPLYSDYVPSHHVISNHFMQKGMIWKSEILWEKNNYNCKYCSWGSWKSPASPYIKYSWEFIEVFCKNDLKKMGDAKDVDITADEFKDFVYGKWSIAPERNMKEFGHDAMFSEKLVERCLKLFSYQNDIVLDPFNGAGTTTKVADALQRRYIGIDIDKTYCETAKKRLEGNRNLFH